MPSVSPGHDESSTFAQILPGAPSPGHKSLATLIFRWKRYIIYLSGKQLNILRGPTELFQAIRFEQDLVAIACEEGDNGRFAVATVNRAWVLKPSSFVTNRVSWTIELQLKGNDTENTIRTLSWGTEGELLVGGTQELCSYNTLPSSRVTSPTGVDADSGPEVRGAQWSKRVANPVQFACFSPDAGLIATVGETHRLVKIWRRLSYEEAIFDYAYLPHNGVVTHLEWRPVDLERLETTVEPNQPNGTHDEACGVLYTISSDGMMSIWRTSGHNDLEIMTLYTTIDLVSAIPHSPILSMNEKSQPPPRYAFIIAASAYSGAVDIALKKHSKTTIKHGIEHLKEVSSARPDVIVVLDAQGRMSAWGLSSIAQRQRSGSAAIDTNKAPFHIAHSEQMGLSFSSIVPTTFQSWFDGDVLNVLAHTFTEEIKWWRGTVENFSSPAALDFDRGELVAVWQGSTDIRFLTASSSSDTLLTCSTDGLTKSFVKDSSGRYCSTAGGSHFQHVIGIEAIDPSSGEVYLTDQGIKLLSQQGQLVERKLPQDLQCNAAGLLRLESNGFDKSRKVLVYDHAGRYVVVNAETAATTHDSSTMETSAQISLDCASPLVAVAVTYHPRKAGWLRMVGVDEAGDIHRRDVAHAALDGGVNASSEPALHFATGTTVSRLAITSSCAALVSASSDELIIIELKEGYVEHRMRLSNLARGIAFPRSSPDEMSLTEHSVLALAFKHSVDVLVRNRYEHPHREGHPHWTTVMKVNIASTGLDIDGIVWLRDHQLVIAARNSIFISDNVLDAKDLETEHRERLQLTHDSRPSLESLVSLIRAPLTCWQPQVLRQLVLHGRFDIAVRILASLQSKLRFYSTGDELDATLDLDVMELLHASGETDSDDVDLSELEDQLQELDLPYTSAEDQARLRLVVQAVSYVARHKASLDVNAMRYLTHWRYHVLLEVHARQVHVNGSINGSSQRHSVDSSSCKAVPNMSWREINFAYHSTTQQPLLELLLQYYENKLEWSTVRSLGITLWLHNLKAAQSEGTSMASVEQILDALAQNAYRASDPPNPADASLYLLALRRKAVLLSLWRVAVGNREQKSTQNFLRRDFATEENRAAARKNAYALMGKRRFQYAAAFFLLADEPLSAISILAGQLEDLPLAITVARAYSGDSSTVLRSFLQDRVIPDARKSIDRWQLSWAHALMTEPGRMLQTLVSNVNGVAHDADVPVRSWQQDDPVTMVIYRELKTKVKRLDRGAIGEEYRAVLRAARILRRMGFWLLAIQLVETWSFKDAALPADNIAAVPTEPVVGNAPSMLDQFEKVDEGTESKTRVASLLDTSEPIPSVANEAQERAAKAAALLAKIKAKNAGKKDETDSAPMDTALAKQQPTQFQEPASSSILDSFGF